jgi:hypothetical protein
MMWPFRKDVMHTSLDETKAGNEAKNRLQRRVGRRETLNQRRDRGIYSAAASTGEVF